MAFYSRSFRIQFFFSMFKKKYLPLQQVSYTSLEHLYHQLSSFQKGLTYLQQKRMPKMLECFQKQLKRLHKIQQQIVPQVSMQLNNTYQFFCRTINQRIFGLQNQSKEVSLDQLIIITRNMVEFGLNAYSKQLIPKVQKNKNLFLAMEYRFAKIQQHLSRAIFKGYMSFSNITSKYAFLQAKQYKGDFKFQLIQNLSILEQATECLYHCALFNQMRSKLALACQLIVTTQLQNISSLTLSRLLYCLAVAGRPLRFIEQNFQLISQKIKDYPGQLLFYMTMSNIQDAIIVKHSFEDLTFQSKNVPQQLINNVLKANLLQKYDAKLKFINKPQLMMPDQKHEGQQFFQEFLKRYQYKYSISQSQNTQHYRIYTIQNKSFLCLDYSLVNRQKWSLNGLGLIFKQHFLNKQISVKNINWPRMLQMETRTQKDEYIFSKFKGIQKPKIVKVRFYD